MVRHRGALAFLLLSVTACLLLGACGRKSPPPPGTPGSPEANWAFEPKAIGLHFKADPELNSYNGKPHTLLLCIYQMTDPTAYNDLSKTNDGIIKLLGCTRFDNSVASFQRVIVQPSEDKTVALDRAEKAQFVAVVAGYYQISPPQVALLYEIPVISTTKGIFVKKTTKTVGDPKIDLFLGPQEMQKLGSK